MAPINIKISFLNGFLMLMPEHVRLGHASIQIVLEIFFWYIDHWMVYDKSKSLSEIVLFLLDLKLNPYK